ncbi:MAG TPA: hypothetical protein VME24_04120 [Alphaproteobacteria bacterium]|nr:hypothetical protein [Alphaproteobacteria bacterium]
MFAEEREVANREVEVGMRSQGSRKSRAARVRRPAHLIDNPNDVETGDLAGDGHKELVFLETTQHYLDIVGFDSRHKLAPAIRWQVFEEHTFRNDSDDSAEPREALLANVTGHKDKKNDLVVVVHDRVLVYPQE